MNCFRYDTDYERILGLPLGLLLVGHAWRYPKEMHAGDLSWLLSMWRSSASSPSFFPFSKAAPCHPAAENHFNHLYVRSHDHRQVLERRRTRKSRAQVELLRWRQYLLCHLERADTLSLVWSHILGFGGARAHPFSLGCEPCTVHVAGPEGTNKTTSSAKSRGEILWAPNQYPCWPPS